MADTTRTLITLSLISHTNVGKTTLARTLLRRDVGEVLDQAHITDTNQAYTLIEHAGTELRLWDTPGFGDSARLMRRLRAAEDDPLTWFIRQQWDRVTDRPLWCGQQAIANIRDEADVVLYLVNAAEEPADAGYIALELELLGWIGRPVILLLNQVGQAGEALEARWRAFVEPWPVVRDVLALDAFARCWTEETVMLERVAALLEDERRGVMRSLITAWNERNLVIFRRSAAAIAAYLTRAALDLELAGAESREATTTDDGAGGAPAGDGPLSGPRTTTPDAGHGSLRMFADALRFAAVDKKRAMTALAARLDVATRELVQSLIAAHDLAGSSAARIEHRLLDFEVRRRMPLDEKSGAVAGAILSGALGGLVADAAIGFLSFGGGMVAGGLLGALGGSALGRGYRLVGGMQEPSVRWSAPFLDLLTREAMLRYLAVAHHGRGRGAFEDATRHAHWPEVCDRALAPQRRTLRKAWTLAERSGSAAETRLRTELERLLERALGTALGELHPRARSLLR
ncbi:MAG: GTPase domain-containing protein [Candidatus Eiseniibacteriota bacterium]|jgi:hypothetical protein